MDIKTQVLLEVSRMVTSIRYCRPELENIWNNHIKDTRATIHQIHGEVLFSIFWGGVQV